MTDMTDLDLVKSILDQWERFDRKLNELSPCETMFSFWVRSAALYMCASVHIVDSRNFQKLHDLTKKVIKGLEYSKNRSDMCLEAQQDIDYCQALYTETFKEKCYNVELSPAFDFCKQLQDPECKINISLSYLMLP